MPTIEITIDSARPKHDKRGAAAKTLGNISQLG